MIGEATVKGHSIRHFQKKTLEIFYARCVPYVQEDLMQGVRLVVEGGKN